MATPSTSTQAGHLARSIDISWTRAVGLAIMCRPFFRAAGHRGGSTVPASAAMTERPPPRLIRTFWRHQQV
jgi:hypothetical protein